MRTYMKKSVVTLSLASRPPGVKAEGRGLPGPGPVLAALSGGADSVALLGMLHALAPERGWRLWAGHVDHGLRLDSAADLEFASALAGELGVPFLWRRVRVKARGRSLEEAAREARRAALRDMAREAGAAAIALAHHADDQAETLLARLLQGTGPSGLAGMRAWSPPFWRPLLNLSRADLRSWLSRRGLAWREDPSNQDLGFMRNRLRHEILPLAEARVNLRAVKALGRLAALCAEEEDYWDSWCAEQSRQRVRAEGSSLWLALPEARALHPAGLRRLLRWLTGRLLGKGQHLLAMHIGQLEELAAGPTGRRLTLPAGLMAWRETGGLRLDIGESPPEFAFALQGPGWVWLPHLRLWLAVERASEPPELKARGWEAFIPAARVAWPLFIRPPRRGERFHPLGAPGSKRLSRFLMDQKVPPWWRRRTVVLADRRGTWWTAPWSLAERARKKPGESAYLRLRFVDTNESPSYTIGFGGAFAGPWDRQPGEYGVRY